VKMSKKIGLSLSFCILDVIDGKVPFADIEKIIAGTHFTDRDHFHTGMKEGYCRTYWRKNPEYALHLAMALWDAGMLDQPRRRREEAPNIADGHWQS